MQKITRKKALSLGLKRYFTGKPCPNGHISPRKTTGRQCLACTREKAAGYTAKHHAKIKREAKNKIGEICVCCKENTKIFLTIHHLNNDGSKHRNLWGNGPGYHRWILRQPIKLLRKQLCTLCANCHLAISIAGYCPHKRKPKS